ncbi:MAG: riboflavin biosynthesis protein RibF [Alloprevotella sp.]|nr:riboflavin biosynthesis protein RibF [Alloprevotella sp.]
MQVIYDIEHLSANQKTALLARQSVATIGFFDGVHQGHAYLLHQLKAEADRRNMQTMVVTFSVHPRKVLTPAQTPLLLTSPQEKTALLDALGIDVCVMLPFTPEFSQLTSQEFLQLYLSERLHVGCLLVGYDHHFGRGSDGDFATYRKEGEACGIDVVRADEWTQAHSPASSSAIRTLLLSGQVSEATRLLGHPYQLSGHIIKGRGVGHLLGYPTANLKPDTADKLLPKAGAYAAKALLGGQAYPAMVYIGRRPTFDDSHALTIEAHLIGAQGQFYGQNMTLLFVDHLRDDQTFASADALRAQLDSDVEHAKRILL